MQALNVGRLLTLSSVCFAVLSYPPGTARIARHPTAQGAGTLTAPALRLPAGVRPTKQSIALTIDPRQEKFSGVIDIEVILSVATPVIWLNGTNLSVREATLAIAGQTLPLRQVKGTDHVIGFRAETDSMGPGSGRLHIVYEASVSRRDVEGVFAQQEGNDWYVFTQFEPLGARRAFPCFDEPGFKIPWQVTLKIPEQDGGFSNTPQVSQERGANGQKTLVFAETQPLPSYLVAVAVGPFEIVDAGKAGRNNIPIRILVPRGRSADAAWAAETTPRILGLLEDYFDMPYPYEKLDQVSVPMFFGAMENAGLVTYGQTLLLQKPGEETIAGRRNYVQGATHELAHQWFGNLVTLAWWDDIWLNESFASWMGQHIAHAFGPDWGMDVDRVRYRSRALELDTRASARRVRQPIESAHDIANAFDGTTYLKGEAVLEMFESWLGEETFRRGVRQYIRDHASRNATSADFVASLSKAAANALDKPLSSFLDQAAAPIISIDLKCDREVPRVTLAQKRYSPLGAVGTQAITWQVPVCIRYGTQGTSARQCTLLTSETVELPLASAARCPSWVLGNDRYTGYYRVRHSAELLDRLLQDNASSLTLAERFGLLTDVPALVATGDLSAARALELASTFASGTNRHTVSATLSIVLRIRPYVREADMPAYEALIRSLYGSHARALGWHSKAREAEDVGLLRSQVVDVVGWLGRDATLTAEALELASRWLDDSKSISPDMIRTVLRVAASSEDSTFFDRVHDLAKREPDRQRRDQLLEALAAFRAPEIVSKVLAITLEPEIDVRESIRLIFQLGWDPSSRESAYAFMKAHYADLVERLPQGSLFDMVSSLPFTASGFCDKARRSDVEGFFTAKVEKAPGGPRNLAQVLESIDLCIAQRNAHESSVSAFLAKTKTAKRP